jgi:UTP:GlnB (protein PII) uridylyltransferase
LNTTHFKSGESAWLQSMVALIVDEVQPERVVLFGSHARGEAREDSDVDLLIIEREPFGPGRSRNREAGRLFRRLAGFGIAKDLLLYSRDEVERFAASNNHVVAHALKEGRLVYEQPCAIDRPGGAARAP